MADFTKSWRDGRAFTALIHSLNPQLFDYNVIQKLDNRSSLDYSFDQAEQNLGITKILDSQGA